MAEPAVVVTAPRLTEFIVEVESAKEPGKREKVKFVAATADFDQPERELEKRYDDKSGKKRITLALQAQAEDAPEQLEEFATSVLRSARPDA